MEFGIPAMVDIAARVLLQLFDINAAEHRFRRGTLESR